MPAFDLRYFQIAEYVYDAETKKVSYRQKTAVGDAISVNLELKYAEGRLFAEGRLSEYMKLATGGTISMGVKRILAAAQAMMFGTTVVKRKVGDNDVDTTRYATKDAAKYVGFSFYVPDMIDGATKYTTMFVAKALFGPPGWSYQTKGKNITFNTSTTVGEFLADDSTDEILIDSAICDTIDDAKAWCDAVLTTAETDPAEGVSDEGNET